MEEVYSLQNTFFLLIQPLLMHLMQSMHLNFVWYLVNFLRGEKLFLKIQYQTLSQSLPNLDQQTSIAKA